MAKTVRSRSIVTRKGETQFRDWVAFKTCVESACGKHRLFYGKVWDQRKGSLVFLMLNPSTADAMNDDPTISKCTAFADLLGWGGISVVNVSTLRSTDPEKTVEQGFPNHTHASVGFSAAARAAPRGMHVVLAYGANVSKGRGKEAVAEAIQRLQKYNPTFYRLGEPTKDGHPRHPLYLSYNTPLQPVQTLPELEVNT